MNFCDYTGVIRDNINFVPAIDGPDGKGAAPCLRSARCRICCIHLWCDCFRRDPLFGRSGGRCVARREQQSVSGTCIGVVARCCLLDSFVARPSALVTCLARHTSPHSVGTHGSHCLRLPGQPLRRSALHSGATQHLLGRRSGLPLRACFPVIKSGAPWAAPASWALAIAWPAMIPPTTPTPWPPPPWVTAAPWVTASLRRPCQLQRCNGLRRPHGLRRLRRSHGLRRPQVREHRAGVSGTPQSGGPSACPERARSGVLELPSAVWTAEARNHSSGWLFEAPGEQRNCGPEQFYGRRLA